MASRRWYEASTTFAEEIAFLKQHIGELQKDGAVLESICVVARTKHLVEGYVSQLQAAGLGTYEIKRNAAEQRDKPGVSDWPRCTASKGLEFEHVASSSRPMRESFL
jgi:hypothetical protein